MHQADSFTPSGGVALEQLKRELGALASRMTARNTPVAARCSTLPATPANVGGAGADEGAQAVLEIGTSSGYSTPLAGGQ